MSIVLLLNDTSDGEHWGCQAAGGSILKASSSLDGISKISRYSVEYSWSFRPCPSNLEDARHLVSADIASLAEIREHIESASLIVVNGEGTLLGNRVPVRNILMFLLIAVETGTPFVILNATIDPDAMVESNKSRNELSTFYRAVFPSARLVTVREARSYHYSRLLGAHKVWHAYDPSIGVFRDITHHGLNSKSKTCVVFGSVLLEQKGTAKLREFLSWFQDSSDCTLTLCAMTKQERPFLQSLSEELDCAFEDYDSLDLEGICNLVDESHITISGRYHGCLLSAARWVPFIHYETHSNRIDDFVRHLCYEDAGIQIFAKNTSEEQWGAALRMWNDQPGRQCFLKREIPFLKKKSELHERLVREVWQNFEETETPAIKEDGNLTEPFQNRARIASGLLSPGMGVVDFGGYTQGFGQIYDFSSYLSIDLIFSQREGSLALGQPENTLKLEDLPFPDLHREIDIDSVGDFTFLGSYEVAVFLGVLPWLKNWMKTLQMVADSGPNQMLISWDEYELDRVSSFMKRLGFEESRRVRLNSKSAISHFVKAS